MNIFEKYKISILAFFLFLIIGVVVSIFRGIQYLYLFAGIGSIELISRIIVINYPNLRQFFRLLGQLIVASILFIWISLIIGVNFQFPQIFFDMYAGVVTGALIQIIIARVILPFFFGNAFCSRACWTGFFFEMTNKKLKSPKKPFKRSEFLAWGYLISLIGLAFSVAFFWNPAEDPDLCKKWIIGENIFIICIGFVLTRLLGSRAYCRLLCPFITLSGLFSRYSWFKITPVHQSDCDKCNLCTLKCPMLIDVRQFVAENKKVSDKMCIVCEKCVSACPHGVLGFTNKKGQKASL